MFDFIASAEDKLSCSFNLQNTHRTNLTYLRMQESKNFAFILK
ncbi:hypothetical protein A1OE_445 [Candidatus Endolissoclinum faulkneri L2]|uniref:Uncharacterized protein n=1 Tax=Candidatus Endolissoclinum faulkneri L2 TaxID=1193729 RepID=K7Z3R7_9PROT|nr:hypothetical protein A1OE_445 [Candidatus Endolissoclinum faulkneri L2]